MVMMALARAMNVSIARVRTSVHIWSLQKPRMCQELARSIAQRQPACNGVPLGIRAWQPSTSSS